MCEEGKDFGRRLGEGALPDSVSVVQSPAGTMGTRRSFNDDRSQAGPKPHLAVLATIHIQLLPG